LSTFSRVLAEVSTYGTFQDSACKTNFNYLKYVFNVYRCFEKRPASKSFCTKTMSILFCLALMASIILNERGWTRRIATAQKFFDKYPLCRYRKIEDKPAAIVLLSIPIWAIVLKVERWTSGRIAAKQKINRLLTAWIRLRSCN
jgi:hypothetical protein